MFILQISHLLYDKVLIRASDPFGALQLYKDVQDVRGFQKRATWAWIEKVGKQGGRVVLTMGDFYNSFQIS